MTAEHGEPKSKLRSRLRRQRRNLTDSELESSSDLVCRHLIQLVESWLTDVRADSELESFQPIKIATYAATEGEIDLEQFNIWVQGQPELADAVAFPVLRSEQNRLYGADAGRFDMALRSWSPETGFELGPFDIPEPKGGEWLQFDQCQLVLTPGVAFSPHGKRLGRGKGYYDQALAFTKAQASLPSLSQMPSPRETLVVGIGHDFQIVSDLPTHEDDVWMDALATPSGIRWCRATDQITATPTPTQLART